jgi:hypothetical protein
VCRHHEPRRLVDLACTFFGKRDRGLVHLRNVTSLVVCNFVVSRPRPWSLELYDLYDGMHLWPEIGNKKCERTPTETAQCDC